MELATKEKTKAGNCPTHGAVEGTKEVPKFTMPGLFWGVRMLGTPFKPYRCPQCGSKVS